jgi:hypothetical protein
VGVVITPLTLKTTPNVAVPASQSIAVGLIVTTASGPVSPFAPTNFDHVYEVAVVGAVALVPIYIPIYVVEAVGVAVIPAPEESVPYLI